jgi:mRNA interferase HigB
MRIVGRDKLDAFCEKHADARKWIEAWIYETEGVAWAVPQRVKDRYPSASFLPGNTVIFNVKGNDYRMEVTVAYKVGVVTVIWVGTHGEYNERNRKR